MTESVQAGRVILAPNGTTTTFALPFKVSQDANGASNVVVVPVTISTGAIGSALVENTDYTVTGVGGTTGSITTKGASSPWSTSYKLVAYTKTPIVQALDYVDNDPMPAADATAALDWIVEMVRGLDDRVSRAAKFDVMYPVSGGISTDIPSTVPVTGAALLWDTTNGWTWTTSSLSTLETNAAAIAAITSDITTVSGISSAVSAVAGISGNVTTVAGISANVTTVAGISANVTTVAGISANVTTVATNIANVNTVAANMATITNAANNIPKANLSASVAPTTSNDASQGYSGGSLWVDTTHKKVYTCTDPTTGSAVWNETDTGTTLSSLSDVSVSTLSNNDFLVYNSTSSKWNNVSAANSRTALGLGALATLSAVTEAEMTLADNTTGNVSITAHGFAPKAPNDATKYLDGTGAYSVPVSSGISSISVQTFTASGTYTPTSGMKYCIVEAVGGGGGGGGTSAVASFAGGGGAGSYSRSVISAATIGASQTVTIGAAGSAGANTGGDGGTGGATSLGTLVTTNGGLGGKGSTASASGVGATRLGGVGGAAGTGDVTSAGWNGGISLDNGAYYSGYGADSRFGAGGQSVIAATGNGNAATGYGAGGSGSTGTAYVGGAGAPGIIIVTEYI